MVIVMPPFYVSPGVRPDTGHNVATNGLTDTLTYLHSPSSSTPSSTSAIAAVESNFPN